MSWSSAFCHYLLNISIYHVSHLAIIEAAFHPVCYDQVYIHQCLHKRHPLLVPMTTTTTTSWLHFISLGQPDSIAAYRGGNKRTNNVSRRCGVVKRGFKACIDGLPRGSSPTLCITLSVLTLQFIYYCLISPNTILKQINGSGSLPHPKWRQSEDVIVDAAVLANAPYARTIEIGKCCGASYRCYDTHMDG